MRQDSDVARVAAAMNAPGFKYRSFGNEPVRIRPGATGTLAQPPAEPVEFVEESRPQPRPETLEQAFTMPEPAPEPIMPEPFLAAPVPLEYQSLAYEGFSEMPEPEPAPLMAPEPMPVAAPTPPPAPLFSWPESPVNPPLAPTRISAPALMPEIAQTYAPPAASAEIQAPMAAGGFRLLESIGHRPGEGEAGFRAAGQSGGTLGMLRRAAESGGSASATTTGSGMLGEPGRENAGPLLPVSPSGHQSGLLPAVAVTVPLSDVMRLIAAGATPPPSPFDAFRAALGAQPGR